MPSSTGVECSSTRTVEYGLRPSPATRIAVSATTWPASTWSDSSGVGWRRGRHDHDRRHGEGSCRRRRQMAGVARLVGGDGAGAHTVEAHGRSGNGAHRGGVGRVGQWQVAGVTAGSTSGPPSSAVSTRPSTVMGVDTASDVRRERTDRTAADSAVAVVAGDDDPYEIGRVRFETGQCRRDGRVGRNPTVRGSRRDRRRRRGAELVGAVATSNSTPT